MKITVISDTHTKHSLLDKDLEGGDMLIHSGDITGSGKILKEYTDFFQWFERQSERFDTCIFIAGNHDWLFQLKPEEVRGLLTGYKNIDYLQDETLIVNDAHVYGTPWQPEFMGWAFNLPRNGIDLEEKFSLIPKETDILITHAPPYGIRDYSLYGHKNVGCEILHQRVSVVKPKIHIFGHIHSSYGYRFDGNTHYFNASVLNEAYNYTNKPISFNWDKEKNSVEFI